MSGANCKIIDIFWRLEDAGVPADLDPPRFGPPGPNQLADKDPPVQIRWRIWTPLRGFGPPTKLSENIVLNVPVKMDDTLRSSAY